MSIQSSLLGFCALIAMSGPALAQTNWVEIDDETIVAPLNQSTDAVDDFDVLDAAGKKIGEVEEVLGATAGAATALTVDFDDGAGFGDRDDVIVPLDRFTYAGNRLTLYADATAVSGIDVYDD